MRNAMIEIIICNLFFWPVYISACMIPYGAVQGMINGAGLNER